MLHVENDQYPLILILIIIDILFQQAKVLPAIQDRETQGTNNQARKPHVVDLGNEHMR